MIERKHHDDLPVIEVPAVQVVLQRDMPDGLEVFLGKRIAGAFINQWSVPGGRIDEGETPEQAAVRETEEETGAIILPGDLIHLRDTSSETVREKSGVTSLYRYGITVFTTDAGYLSPYNASPDEHSEMRWMSIPAALSMHNAAVNADHQTGRPSTPDKILGALAPRTHETLLFMSRRR